MIANNSLKGSGIALPEISTYVWLCADILVRPRFQTFTLIGSPRPSHDDALEISNEHTLLARIQVGDADAFRIIVETYIGRITEFAAAMVRSNDVAEDVVQKVFVWMWENRETLDIKGRLKPYLFRAVRNRILDYRKSEAIRSRYQGEMQGQILGELAMTPSSENAILTADMVQAALRLLSERKQQAVRLRLFDDMTHSEIADILGVTPEASAQLVSRALTDLKKILTEMSN